MIKFKLLPKSQFCHVRGGYASNGQWLFRIDWIKSISSPKKRGLLTVLRRIEKMQVSETILALDGRDMESRDLAEYVRQVSLDGYRIPERAPTSHDGYVAGRYDDYGPAFIAFGTKGPFFDQQLAVALEFDPENTEVLIAGDKQPLVIRLKSCKSIVGLIMPLSPTHILAHLEKNK